MALYGGPSISPVRRPLTTERSAYTPSGSGGGAMAPGNQYDAYRQKIASLPGYVRGDFDPAAMDVPQDDQALRDETANQGARRGYYDAREAGADTGSDAAYNAYQTSEGGLASELEKGYDTFHDPNQAPVDQGYGSYAGGAGKGLYGNVDDPNLSQYGDKSYYQPGAGSDHIDPNSDLGKSIARERSFQPQDYSALYRSMAGGANDQLTSRIQQATGNLESTAAGAGRLDSTLFSRDAGQLYQNLASDTRAQLSQGALQAAGYTEADRASARSAEGGIGNNILDYLNMNRTSAQRAGEAAASAGAERARLAQGNRAASRSAYEGDRTYARNAYEDTRNFDYKNYSGEIQNIKDAQKYRQGVYSDQYKAATDRSATAYGRAEDQRGAYRDLLSGQADRAAQVANAKANRNNSTLGGIISTAGKVATVL